MMSTVSLKWIIEGNDDAEPSLNLQGNGEFNIYLELTSGMLKNIAISCWMSNISCQVFVISLVIQKAQALPEDLSPHLINNTSTCAHETTVSNLSIESPPPRVIESLPSP